MQFKSLEEQIQYQEKNIEYLQQQNFDLQNQISQFSQFQQLGITIDAFQSLQNTSKEQSQQIKQLQKDNKNQLKQIQNNQVKYYDKTLSNLQQENVKLKNEIRQLRQRISSPSKLDKSIVQYSTPQKQLNPSAILKSTKDHPKDVASLLFIKGSQNFKSPFVDIIKGKYENVKVIKQLKSGLEQSYFDTYHFDVISQDLQYSLQQLDRQHSIHQGKGLLLSNQLSLIYGASRTNKKHFLIQYLDTLISQIKQQFEIFQQNEDYKQLTVKIVYEEFFNGQTKHPSDSEVLINKEQSKRDNESKVREIELSISKLRLIILNKLKMTIKDNSKKYVKIRKLYIETELQFNKESQVKKFIVFTSNSNLNQKQFQNAEEGLNESLAMKDKGKELTQILRWPQLQISLVLCVHPTIPDYALTINTFQLCKFIRNLKLVSDSPQSSDKFQQILENNNKSLEQKIKQLREKIKNLESENYRVKKQSLILEAENEEAVDKNRKLKQQLANLTGQLQQLQMNFQQQISAKKSLTLSKTKSAVVADNKTIQTLEKAARSISVLLSQNSKVDLSVSPSKVQKTLPSDLLMPNFQENPDDEEDYQEEGEDGQEDEDQMDEEEVDSEEPSEVDESEGQDIQQPRKESSISMI
ncbi:unnamed protein product (macronuclear) [Paramecium tetraurelia]|uniref:Kinesin motor domain-containing protein n=1 Tax=Paramecium tetraurelia TaxID=5888 RepID=A0CH53_PARTE|nr:uncharacterized protein GSPATT00007560001 [Paramecium tetraurelia]CAK70120.1 unnamed protein product [Paramecium tetraurelia]|eukprot:XP_001437517.1 hypothetical protein (macronuclear) [Paramecium tetraurelia strain d4-2]